MGLVQDDEMPVLCEKHIAIAEEQRISGEHQIGGGNVTEGAGTLRPVQASRCSCGAKRVASARQFGPTLVGQTTRQGRSRRPACFSTRMWARVCTVLPRPMSSARMPPRP